VVGDEESAGVGLHEHVAVLEAHAQRDGVTVLLEPQQELLLHVEGGRAVGGALLHARQRQGGLAHVGPGRAHGLTTVPMLTNLRRGRRVEKLLRALRPDDPRVTLEVEGGLGYPPLERTPQVVALFEQARAVAAEMGMQLGEISTGGASEGLIARLGRTAS
jgi:glutamate carboxypeptidase